VVPVTAVVLVIGFCVWCYSTCVAKARSSSAVCVTIRQPDAYLPEHQKSKIEKSERKQMLCTYSSLPASYA
jgi:hypothetical protein